MPLLRIIDEECLAVPDLPNNPYAIRVVLKARKNITVQVEAATDHNSLFPLVMRLINDDGSVSKKEGVYFELVAGVSYAGYVYCPNSSGSTTKVAFFDAPTRKLLCVTRNSQRFYNSTGPS